MEETMLIEILKEMQKKYQCIVEIERITRDMGESLSRNDRTSAQLLLGMRQEEMDKADVFERHIKCLLSSMEPMDAVRMQKWIKGEEGEEPGSPMEEKLVEKGKNIQRVLERTITIDRHISTRLAGKDSFYK